MALKQQQQRQEVVQQLARLPGSAILLRRSMIGLFMGARCTQL